MRIIAWIGLFVFLLGSGASATITDFTWTPTEPVLGSMVTYQAIDDGMHPVISYKWEYRITDGDCTSGWTTGESTIGTQFWTHSFPGTLEVRMTATYSPFVNKPQTEIIKQLTIPKADGFVITKGLGVPTNNDPTGASYLEVNFKVQCNGKDAGTMIGAIAQEKFTNIILLGNTRPDSDWEPDQPHGRLYLQGNVIIDQKSNQFPQALWDSIPVNHIFQTKTQHMRLSYTDSCGNARTMYLLRRIVR